MTPRLIDFSLVVIDERPIRREALESVQRAASDLEKLKRDLETFEKRDQPAFESWVGHTFSDVIQEMRECAFRIQEKRYLMARIEEEAEGRGISFREAYENILEGKALTDQEPDPARELFEESLHREKIDPESLGEDEYEDEFSRFKAQHGFDGPARTRDYSLSPEGEARLKKLYRELARKLHPDVSEQTDATRAMWVEVQNVYERGDIVRIEALYAQIMKGGEAHVSPSSIWDLRLQLGQIRRSIRSLQRSLRVKRKDRAWGFSRSVGKKKRQFLKREIAREFDMELREIREAAEEVEDFFERWLNAA